MALSSRRIIVLVLAACVLAAGLVALRMNGQVDRALDVPVISERPVERVPVPERPPLAFWTSEDVEGFVALPNGVWAAGADWGEASKAAAIRAYNITVSQAD